MRAVAIDEYAPWRGMIGRGATRLWCSAAISNFLMASRMAAVSIRPPGSHAVAALLERKGKMVTLLVTTVGSLVATIH